MDSRGFPVPILDGNQGGGGLLLVVQRVAEKQAGGWKVEVEGGFGICVTFLL